MNDIINDITTTIEHWNDNRESMTIRDLQDTREQLTYYGMKLSIPHLTDAKTEHALASHLCKKCEKEMMLVNRDNKMTIADATSKAYIDCDNENVHEITTKATADQIKTIEDWLKVTINTIASRIKLELNMIG